MTSRGKFFGIGVGPGPAKMLTVAAWEALQEADVILVPRAKNAEQSIARQCLADLDLKEEKFREVLYNMDPDREQIDAHYQSIARSILEDLEQNKTVAYLTIGDSLTYSTYSYTLEALLSLAPALEHKTFPGITSFAATASALAWPLGQGKERTLILPCPDDALDLRKEIEGHDIVVLMKIGNRMPTVLEVLDEMGIAEYCAFASRIGLPGEVLSTQISDLKAHKNMGYLSTMLIRKTPTGKGNS